MGCKVEDYYTVCDIIAECTKIKRELNLPVTIGMQMVFMPEFADQVIPLAKLGKKLGVDYLVIKHCSDDEEGSVGVAYDKYSEYTDILKQSENLSDDIYLVKVKWSKILSGPKRIYSRC